MAFEIEITNLESLNSGAWPLPLHLPKIEAFTVNFSIDPFSNCLLTLFLVLHFVKHLSPKIVVFLDRGCNRTDVSFRHRVIHAI